MANVVESDKNFLVIETSNIEVIRLGGFGICDACAKASDKGYIIPVLAGRWYCPKCYEEWHKGAINYEEDRDYEKMVFDKYSRALNVVAE